MDGCTRITGASLIADRVRSTARPEEGAVRILVVVLVAWLLIGVFAVFQRGYLGSSSTSCAHIGTATVPITPRAAQYRYASTAVQVYG